MKKLKRAFFNRPTLNVAKDLIGKKIVVLKKNKIKSGIIVETEAYTNDDPACHASRGKTPRNEIMFGKAGFTYVYFIYGMYFCLNFVTEEEHIPGAVLIRALETSEKDFRIASGPGKLCNYLGLSKDDNKIDVCKLNSKIYIEETNYLEKNKFSIVQSTRIGISKASHFPWRWYVKESPSISKAPAIQQKKCKITV